IALFLLRKQPWLGFGLLWFFIQLIPTNSLVPRLDPVNDRQAYLPLVGLAMATGIYIARFSTRSMMNRRGYAVAILLGLLGYFTLMRNRDYRSEILLWEDTARKSPAKARVFNNLGYAYSLAGRHDEGCSAYRKALSLNPDYDIAKGNLA